MSRIPIRTALLLAASLALTGCAGQAPEAPADGVTSTPSSSTGSTSPSSAVSAAGQRVEVQVADGQVTGDTGRVSVAAGEQVTLSITSDAADVVHVHGYDLTAELTPGTPAELTFAADIPGVFEVELHEAGTVLLTLQVQ